MDIIFASKLEMSINLRWFNQSLFFRLDELMKTTNNCCH